MEEGFLEILEGVAVGCSSERVVAVEERILERAVGFSPALVAE